MPLSRAEYRAPNVSSAMAHTSQRITENSGGAAKPTIRSTLRDSKQKKETLVPTLSNA